ncbi:MAG: DUF4297 domain-containing protein [Cytophagia bacterium]|nr:DUF4297 domain-containing protein [Cytophagia bacterium]
MPEEKISKPMLHEVPPRENSGRDTIARYNSQFKGTAYECLSLLEDKSLDRVYCDYQDDCVLRFNLNGEYTYNFHQVKTKSKSNHQWSINELLGINKRANTADPNKILQSFIGKLLIHTVKFNTSCGKVVFLTNIHFKDEVENLMKAVVGGKENRHYKLLLENFNKAFTPDNHLEEKQIIALIKKLNLRPNISYLSPNDDTFSAIARESVFRYSEIDLSRTESEQIISNLISLVERKSFSKLVDSLSESDLDEAAGISLNDMLDLLSISKDAYNTLKIGGDSNAIKSASIIQRLMSKSNATEPMIEFISNCKVNWDIWLRDKRHTMAEFDLNFLLENISEIASSWVIGSSNIDDLYNNINDLFEKIIKDNLSKTLSKELLLGAIFSSIVRNEA